MSNYIADKSYVAVKPQVDAITPIIPTKFIPLVSEGIKVNPNFTADRRMKGLSWKSDELLKGSRTIEGPITVLADPDALGHILNMVYAKGSSTGDALSGYTHPFAVGDGKSYTVEFGVGIYAKRIWGVRGDSVKVDFVDNKMQAAVSVKALGQFYSASLAIALTGAGMVSAVFSTDSDLRPADGLVIGDTIIIGGTEVVLTSINVDGKTVGFASTAITASVGDAVYLKAQNPSYGTIPEPFYFGNTLVGVAATSALADTAAGSRATSVPAYTLTSEFKNNLLSAPATGYTGPAILANQVREATLAIKQLFTNPTLFQKWIERIKQSVTVIATGRFIKSDLSTSEMLTIKYHKVKAITTEAPLTVGEYIYDTQNFEVLYDSADGKAIEISLVNRTAGTEY